MPTLLPNGQQQFFTATGAPLAGAKLYTYIPGTTTPKATFRTYAGTTANTNPVIANSRGEMAVYWSGDYDVVLKDANNVLIWGPERLNETESAGSAAAVSTALAASTGSSLVGLLNTGTGAVTTSVQSRLRDSISAKDFGALGNGTSDDTLALQAAINESISSGRALHIPAGTYKTTATLVITDELTMQGDGANNTIINFSVAVTAPAISIEVPNNASFIGGLIGGFQIDCNVGAAAGSGISINTTATNSAISQSVFHDIRVKNCFTGFFMDGVVYMSTFRNIIVTGSVAGYGFYSDSAKDTTYNTFENIEVTGVGNSAYAYWIKSDFSHFTNLTADGCCYFSSPGGHVQGLTIEGIYAATAASNYCIQSNQVSSLSDIALRNVPTAKCQYGIDVLGSVVSINNVRMPDSGAGNQPNRLLNLHAAGTGTVENIQLDRAIVDKLEAYLAQSILNGFVFSGCASITSNELTYQEGTWTPSYATWSTAPTTSSANYIKIGRQVTVSLTAQNGVCNAGSTITGLPFTSRSSSTAAACGSCDDTTKRIAASVRTSATALSNVPALTLTGSYWDLTCTYFI